VRIGMTGTLPEDAQKREMICCRVGGDVIYGIESAQLALAGFISKSKINMVELKHSNEERDEWLKKKAWAELPWSWEIETKYLNTNKKRLETIAKFIQNVSTENTLILCSKEIGGRLAEMTGLPFIDGETDPEARIKLYEAFKDKKNVKLLATFGTSVTGISIDDVFCGVLIDAGKDSIRILQGIGRMLRLDTEGRHFVTIYDVWSSLKYSSRHRNQRVKLYKQRGIEYDADWKINKILP
ncbi:MAG: helicase-related protein, partial [Nitrosopumilaceae archaeon]